MHVNEKTGTKYCCHQVMKQPRFHAASSGNEAGARVGVHFPHDNEQCSNVGRQKQMQIYVTGSIAMDIAFLVILCG